MPQEIHPQTFADGDWTWIDPAKTHNNNLGDYGYFNEQVADTQAVLAVWSAFETPGEWEDDGEIKVKITTIGYGNHQWALHYSDQNPTEAQWWNPAYHEVLRAFSGDNVSEQTYSAEVPEGFDWSNAKVALLDQSAGPPITPTARVFDVWGEGVLGAILEEVVAIAGPGAFVGELYTPQIEKQVATAGGEALVTDTILNPLEDVGLAVGVATIVGEVNTPQMDPVIAEVGVGVLLSEEYHTPQREHLGQILAPKVLVTDHLMIAAEDVVAVAAPKPLVADVFEYVENLVVGAGPEPLVLDQHTVLEPVVATVGVWTRAVSIHGLPVSLLGPRLITFTNPSQEIRTILANGVQVDRTTGTRFEFDHAGAVRAYLRVVRGQLSPAELAALPTPMDMVRLTWTEVEGESYEIYRDAELVVAGLNTYQYLDGPLDDGVYDYKVRAIDPEGDYADSAVKEVTVATPPDPPTMLTYSWNGGTKTLTLSWTASPSSDVAHYHVYCSDGDDELLLTEASILKDAAGVTTDIAFTDETGTYIFLIRAHDTSGREEENIDQVLMLPFQSGSLALPPAEPQYVRAESAEDGKIKVTWTYYQGQVSAVEARIYYDNGSGEVSYASPLDTVAMGASAETYEWTSGVLTDDQEYLFTVRAATDEHPDGVETTNADVHAATPDSDEPAQPTLTAEVV